jgi:hypothetical protein
MTDDGVEDRCMLPNKKGELAALGRLQQPDAVEMRLLCLDGAPEVADTSEGEERGLDRTTRPKCISLYGWVVLSNPAMSGKRGQTLDRDQKPDEGAGRRTRRALP